MIFKDKFDQLKLPAADLTLILNVNSTLSMAIGLINGPLLRQFGYRKISIIAAILFAGGLMLTAVSNSIFSILLAYSVITGLWQQHTTHSKHTWLFIFKYYFFFVFIVFQLLATGSAIPHFHWHWLRFSQIAWTKHRALQWLWLALDRLSIRHWWIGCYICTE